MVNNLSTYFAISVISSNDAMSSDRSLEGRDGRGISSFLIFTKRFIILEKEKSDMEGEEIFIAISLLIVSIMNEGEETAQRPHEKVIDTDRISLIERKENICCNTAISVVSITLFSSLQSSQNKKVMVCTITFLFLPLFEIRHSVFIH